ncbi:MAG: proton-conducting membrane transporter [Halobacteriota archaeon]
MTDDEIGRAGSRSSMIPGLAAVGLFVVMAAAIASSAFGTPVGFPEGESIVAHIGYALFDLDMGTIATEGFLAAFLIIAIALDVAVDAAIFLAKREEEGSIVTAITDGGVETSADGRSADRGGDR